MKRAKAEKVTDRWVAARRRRPVRSIVEAATGIWWGSHDGWSEAAHGPRPVFAVAIRPRRGGWARTELILPWRSYWLTWGEELTPGERVDNIMARVDDGPFARYAPVVVRQPPVDVVVVLNEDHGRQHLGRSWNPHRAYDDAGRLVVGVADGVRQIVGRAIGEVEWTSLAWNDPRARELDEALRRGQMKAGR